MRRFFSYGLTIALLAACSTQEKDFKTPQQDDVIYYASFEQSAEKGTRVYANEDHLLRWTADDRVSIFGKNTYNQEYRFDGETGDNAGTFSRIPGDVFVTGNALPAIYAVYPYREETTISDDCGLTIILQETQSYSEKGFGLGANAMVSATEDNNLLFKNLGGYLVLKLYGEDVKVSSISLKGNNGEKLAGKAYVTAPLDNDPSLSMYDDAAEELTLACPVPVTLGSSAEEFTEFWFVLPPTTFSQGFTVKVTNPAGKTFEKKTTNEVVITRNHLSRMSPVEVVLPFWDDNTVPPDNEIWYITSDDTIIYLEASYPFYNSRPFDSNVVSHTYENGLGVIRCDGPITVLNDHVFGNGQFKKVTDIFLPNSVTTLRTGSLSGVGIRQLRLPDNLDYVGSYALCIPTLEKFSGKNVSEDGRCVFFQHGFAPFYGNTVKEVEGYLAAFAPSGVSSYTLPSETRILGPYAFSKCMELKNIILNEGLECIMADCFSHDVLDCDIILPSSLLELDPYAFHNCSGIKGFYGNEKFHTEDNHCLYHYTDDDKYISMFVGDEITDYTIPEGVTGIENYAFQDKQNLRTLTLPSTIKHVGPSAIYRCENLEALWGECTSEDHRAVVFGTQFNRLFVTKGIKSYVVPEGYTSLGYCSFRDAGELEEVIVPDSVKQLGGYDFAHCPSLKKVVLSSSLERIDGPNPFLHSPSLEEIYFRSFIPPYYDDTQFYESDCSNLTVYVPEETLDLYKADSNWAQYAPYMVGYKYDDIEEFDPDYYMSSDFSANGHVTTLQIASSGPGCNVILMGDAFSDRQIADGTYAAVMEKAMEALFSEEPYKSFRGFFNVYSVDVVSITEGYEHGGRTLGTAFGSGTYVSGHDNKVIEFARKAIPESAMDDALIIVMMNIDAYAGTCYMYSPPSGDYGRGLSIAYFPISSDTETFNGLVSHEAGGHGFAKLADEYAYEKLGAIGSDEIASARRMEPYGWWKNVDFTGDPTKVKWSRFIYDNRYVNESIGCYEGGMTYWNGVWRPTEDSIMRYNTGGFNAPSRYAIWYRINKLAYGEGWNGSYEDFVADDAFTRTPAAATRRKAQRNLVEKRRPPLAPPVVVGHGWREESAKAK